MKGLPDVADLILIGFLKRHYGEDKVLRLIQRVQNLILGHRDRVSAADASLHFQKTQSSRAGNPRLDVVSELVRFPVNRLESEPPLDIHHYGACTRSGGSDSSLLTGKR